VVFGYVVFKNNSADVIGFEFKKIGALGVLSELKTR
jgi:hypothetical protein